MEKFIIGVDEVGRGPLAGPVAVGVFVINHKHQTRIKKIFSDARDSKKLTPQKREEIFNRIKIMKEDHIVRYIVLYESNKFIDKHGISKAIKSCIDKSFRKLSRELNLNAKNTEIFLDGGLKAPKEFFNQKTIIKGDDKILAISLASIVAKVSRDTLMVKLHKKFPNYDFHIHKGYGTKKHLGLIKKFGLSPYHRKSWIT